jgi:hypothetical protein
MYDFLIEEAISEASCYDIAMEQYNAEMEVLTALSEAYFKQLQMVEYFQEGELADSAKVAGVAAGIGAIGIGAAALWLITLPIRIIIALIKGIINIIKRIYNMFRKVREKDIQRAIDKLKAMPANKRETFKVDIQNISTVYNPKIFMIKDIVEMYLNKFNELTSSEDPVKDFDNWKTFEKTMDEQFAPDIDSSHIGSTKLAKSSNGNEVEVMLIYLEYKPTLNFLESLKYTASKISEYKEIEKKFESLLKTKEKELNNAKKEGDASSSEESDVKKKTDEIRRIGKKFIKCLNDYVSTSFKWYYAVTHQIFKVKIDTDDVKPMDVDVRVQSKLES